MRVIATTVSYLFHPLLLATYLYATLAFLFPAALFPVTERSLTGVLLLIFVTTFVLPAINVYFFKAFGTIKSMHMRERQERVGPFLMITVLYGVITYLLHSRTGIGWQDPFMKFLLVIDLLVATSFIATLVMKASIHSLAAGGIVVIMASLNQLVENGVFFYPMLLSIGLAGLIMSARLMLNAHTLREVAVGFSIGLTVSVAGVVYLFY